MKKQVTASAITAAENDDALKDALDNVKDDFEYILMGCDVLTRGGSDSAKTAAAILSDLRVSLGDYINRIASTIQE